MGEPENWLDPKFKKIVERLGRKRDVATMAHHPSEVFVNLFRQHWWNGLRYFKSQGMSRSNWTYNTANAFLNTCRDMDMKCTFETEGKHDGVITNRLDQSILYAEWEWDHISIFGEKGELKKLARSVQSNLSANALLFTYVPQDEYEEFTNQVIENWTKLTDAALYYFTPVLKRTENGNEIFTLRVIDIQRNGLIVWNDH